MLSKDQRLRLVVDLSVIPVLSHKLWENFIQVCQESKLSSEEILKEAEVLNQVVLEANTDTIKYVVDTFNTSEMEDLLKESIN
jgi:hypothetical protein